MGDRYGPKLITREPMTLDEIRGKTIAIPGKLTTAYLTLQLCLGKDVRSTIMPFDQILPAVAEGRVDVGLIIHEGQLFYEDKGPAPGPRPRRVVVRPDRPAPAPGRQRRPQGPGRRRSSTRSPACWGEHRVRPVPSPRGPGICPELRPRPRPRPGRSLRRDVRERLDRRLRPPGPRGRADPPGPGRRGGLVPAVDVEFVG